MTTLQRSPSYQEDDTFNMGLFSTPTKGNGVNLDYLPQPDNNNEQQNADIFVLPQDDENNDTKQNVLNLLKSITTQADQLNDMQLNMLFKELSILHQQLDIAIQYNTNPTAITESFEKQQEQENQLSDVTKKDLCMTPYLRLITLTADIEEKVLKYNNDVNTIDLWNLLIIYIAIKFQQYGFDNILSKIVIQHNNDPMNTGIIHKDVITTILQQCGVTLTPCEDELLFTFGFFEQQQKTNNNTNNETTSLYIINQQDVEQYNKVYHTDIMNKTNYIKYVPFLLFFKNVVNYLNYAADNDKTAKDAYNIDNIATIMFKRKNGNAKQQQQNPENNNNNQQEGGQQQPPKIHKPITLQQIKQNIIQNRTFQEAMVKINGIKAQTLIKQYNTTYADYQGNNNNSSTMSLTLNQLLRIFEDNQCDRFLVNSIEFHYFLILYSSLNTINYNTFQSAQQILNNIQYESKLFTFNDILLLRQCRDNYESVYNGDIHKAIATTTLTMCPVGTAVAGNNANNINLYHIFNQLKLHFTKSNPHLSFFYITKKYFLAKSNNNQTPLQSDTTTLQLTATDFYNILTQHCGIQGLTLQQTDIIFELLYNNTFLPPTSQPTQNLPQNPTLTLSFLNKSINDPFSAPIIVQHYNMLYSKDEAKNNNNNNNAQRQLLFRNQQTMINNDLYYQQQLATDATHSVNFDYDNNMILYAHQQRNQQSDVIQTMFKSPVKQPAKRTTATNYRKSMPIPRSLVQPEDFHPVLEMQKEEISYGSIKPIKSDPSLREFDISIPQPKPIDTPHKVRDYSQYPSAQQTYQLSIKDNNNINDDDTQSKSTQRDAIMQYNKYIFPINDQTPMKSQKPLNSRKFDSDITSIKDFAVYDDATQTKNNNRQIASSIITAGMNPNATPSKSASGARVKVFYPNKGSKALLIQDPTTPAKYYHKSTGYLSTTNVPLPTVNKNHDPNADMEITPAFGNVQSVSQAIPQWANINDFDSVPTPHKPKPLRKPIVAATAVDEKQQQQSDYLTTNNIFGHNDPKVMEIKNNKSNEENAVTPIATLQTAANNNNNNEFMDLYKRINNICGARQKKQAMLDLSGGYLTINAEKLSIVLKSKYNIELTKDKTQALIDTVAQNPGGELTVAGLTRICSKSYDDEY